MAESIMYGGNGDGTDWDDGRHTSVRKIIVVHSAVCIYSIRVDYINDVLGERHGGEGTEQTKKVTIELAKKEFLTKVSGHYGPVVGGGDDVIRSLTFESNLKKTYGPYGSETQGIPFSFAEGGANILGFKGRSNEHRLTKIGFYYHVESVSCFKKFERLFQ